MRLFSCLLLISALAACTVTSPEKPESGYLFFPDPLKGTAEGTPFAYVQGSAEKKSSGIVTVTLYDISYTANALPDSAQTASSRNQIKIHLPADSAVHDLKEWNVLVQVCDTVAKKKSISINTGAVQITKIDSAAHILEGRADFRNESGTNINGTFSAYLK